MTKEVYKCPYCNMVSVNFTKDVTDEIRATAREKTAYQQGRADAIGEFVNEMKKYYWDDETKEYIKEKNCG